MGDVVMGGVRDMGVVGVGEIVCGWTDGENRRFLDTAEFSLLLR